MKHFISTKITILGFFIFFNYASINRASAENVIYTVTASSYSSPTGSIDITILGGMPPYQVTWNGPEGFFSMDEDIFSLEPGIYTLEVQDAECGKVSMEIEVPTATSIPANNLEKFNISPNPASDFIWIQSPSSFQNTHVHIYSILGELKYSVVLISPLTQLDISEWNSGQYFIQFVHPTQIINSKLVKL